jgi:predicted component of type VI protein secretion system
MRKVILSFALIASVLTACKSEKKEKVVTKEAVKVAAVADLNNADVTSSVITWKGTKPNRSA